MRGETGKGREDNERGKKAERRRETKRREERREVQARVIYRGQDMHDELQIWLDGEKVQSGLDWTRSVVGGILSIGNGFAGSEENTAKPKMIMKS